MTTCRSAASPSTPQKQRQPWLPLFIPVATASEPVADDATEDGPDQGRDAAGVGIAGRVATLRVLGLPAPRLKGFALFQNWLRLPMGQKLKSTLGTARRVFERGYFKPLAVASGQTLAWREPLTDEPRPDAVMSPEVSKG